MKSGPRFQFSVSDRQESGRASTKSSRRARALILAWSLAAPFTQLAGLGAQLLQFQLDPSRSPLVLKGSFVGTPFVEQTSGSLTSSMQGTITVSLDATNLQVLPGSQLVVQTNGAWLPNVGGAAGAAPANFGGEISSFLASAYGALRHLQFEMDSAPLSVAESRFDASGLKLHVTTQDESFLDFSFSGLLSASGRRPLTGDTNDAATASATLERTADAYVLTIPLSINLPFDLLAAGDTQVGFVGTVVATTANSGPHLDQVMLQGALVILTWMAQTNGTYQVATSPDLLHWTAFTPSLTFTNSLGRYSAPASSSHAFFRLQYTP